MLIFDKTTKTFNTITNTEGLIGNNIKSIAIDRFNNRWVLCYNEGITILSEDGERHRNITDFENLPSLLVSAIASTDSIIIVGTGDGAWIYELKQDNPIDEYRSGEKVTVYPSNTISEIITKSDSIFFGTDEGIGVVKKDELFSDISNWNTYENIPGGSVLSLIFFRDTLWAGTDTGTARRVGDNWYHIGIDNPVQDFAVYKDTLYCATDDGVYLWNGENWDKKFNYKARALASDTGIGRYDACLWIGVWGEGIVKCPSETMYIPDGPTTNSFSSIAIDIDGSIWGTHYHCRSYPEKFEISHLYLEDGEYKWEIYNKNNEWNLTGGGPRWVIVDKNGNKYFGMWDYDGNIGLMKLSPDGVLDTIDLPESKVVCGMCFDKEGNLWVGTWEQPLYKIRNDSIIEQFNNKYTFKAWELVCDLEGNIWVGSSWVGLSYFTKDGNWQHIEGLSSSEILALFVDKKNRAWVGTSGETYCLGNQVVTGKYSINGTMDIIEDIRGRIFFATLSDGIKMIDKNGQITTYTSKDGLVSNRIAVAINDNVQSFAFDRERGYLWISTREGLSRFYTGVVPDTLPFIKVYPNPWVLKESEEITFKCKNLKTIYIYTLSGRLVYKIEDIEDSYPVWNGRNEKGDLTGSGIYIFRVVTEEGKSKIGKFAVIR